MTKMDHIEGQYLLESLAFRVTATAGKQLFFAVPSMPQF